MERRKFIRDGCGLCIGLAGGSALMSLLNSCSPVPFYKTVSADSKLSVPLSQFGESNYMIAQPSDLSYDVAIVKTGEASYISFIMKCTHADNPVRFNGKEFRCDLHGSIFSRLGEVKTGPASRNLIRLRTEKKEDTLIIHLV